MSDESMAFADENIASRQFPLKQPKNWKPKVPRWTLKLPDTVTELGVTYVGLQVHPGSSAPRGTATQAASAIEEWLTECVDRPLIVDKLEVVSGWDVTNTLVWICYWTSVASLQQALAHLNLRSISDSLGEGKGAIGLWRESFTPDLSRFETNYAGTDYQPGIAQVLGSEQEPHKRTGYWGAARDRITSSAYDELGGEGDHESSPPNLSQHKQYSHFLGSNRNTIAHIRSGQWWENCTDEEAEAYETKLEPALRTGLADIGQRPLESGDFGVRFLRNLPPTGVNTNRPRKETCGAGFFRSLADMEKWAKDCPSHHTIYNGAIKHKMRFGADAKFRTWHEVSVLQPGEATFEYLNCSKETGTLPFLYFDNTMDAH